MSSLQLKENIEKAELAIREKRQSVQLGKTRQKYHFMAECGWINDPNGLIYFRGKYHLFYQFNPFGPEWSRMHWGHAVSDNMVDWTYLPIALAPSETYDSHERGGCFSGTALEHEGTLYLLYTGTSKTEEGFVQVQCLAESFDGITFSKYEGNPVLKVTEGYEECDFRDPKIWKHKGRFYLACAAKKSGYAKLLLYRSENLKSWEYISVMAESRGEWGEMWECPDFYSINGMDILTFSPIGAGERTTVYMIGKLDYRTGKFCCLKEGEIDWGFDYYAPQTLEDAQGRRIMFGWAGGWDWMPWWKGRGPSWKEGWSGFFGIPREVRMISEDILQFIPVKELEYLREKELADIPELNLTGDNSFSLPDAGIYELKLTIDLENTSARLCILRLRGNKDYYTDVVLDFENMELTVDRNHSDGWSSDISRSIFYPVNKEKIDIHIFMDQSSVEVFANEYTNVHTCCIYPENNQMSNRVISSGGTVFIKGMKMWSLKNSN